jgi:hypothetical protein
MQIRTLLLTICDPFDLAQDRFTIDYFSEFSVPSVAQKPRLYALISVNWRSKKMIIDY